VVRVLALLILALGCSDPKPASNDPPKICKLDADCAGRGYCTEAGICRRDCTVDAHCIGPGLGGQCNAQGKCIEPVDASPPGDASEPETAGEDAPAEGGA
jgi:hypothetical protein